MTEHYKAQPFDCMQFLNGAVQEPLIRVLVRFDGRLDEAAFRKAVLLSVKAVPLISCCFHPRKHCWQKRDFTAEDIIHPVTLEEGQKNPAERLLVSSIDCSREPQLKIYLVREPGRDTLCMIVNHMVCDGAGFKKYLSLLGELYSRCRRDPDDSDVPVLCPDRGLAQILRNLRFRDQLSILLSGQESHAQDSRLVLPLKGDRDHPFVVVRRLSRETFETMKRRAGDRGATVNDMLMTAYIRALFHATGCRTIALSCPVDLRRYLHPGQECGICNLTGNYFCKAELDAGEPFDVTLASVSEQMKAQKKENSCLRGPMKMDILFHILPFRLFRRRFYQTSPVPFTSYSNLGIFEKERFRFEGLEVKEVIFGTAVKYAPYFQVSVATFGDCCTLTSSTHGTEQDRKIIGDLLADMEKELA